MDSKTKIYREIYRFLSGNFLEQEKTTGIR